MISLEFKCEKCGEEQFFSVYVHSGTQSIIVTCDTCGEKEENNY